MKNKIIALLVKSQIANFNHKNTLLTSAAVNAPTSLNSSMISRIHNVKPGCGGCGRS